jgi:PleD family two-component response regulator
MKKMTEKNFSLFDYVKEKWDAVFETIYSTGLKTGRQPKVLIIDPDNKNAEKVRVKLQESGYRVSIHSSNLGMMATIKEEKPDLILLEIKMPLLDGPKLCRLVKNNPKSTNTPIVLYTSLNEKRLEKKVTEFGAEGYINKNWNIGRIVNSIPKYLPSLYLEKTNSPTTPRRGLKQDLSK